MWWPFGAKLLRSWGILGMNRRNATCILDHNPRSLYPIVDDKFRMQSLCERIGVPCPAIYAVLNFNGQLRFLSEILANLSDFVIKPNRGSAGRGILVITSRDDATTFRRHNGEPIGMDQIRQHLSDILSGMYSLGGRPDQVLIQQRVKLHPAFEKISYRGIPDVRVVLYRHEPAMAMLRLPTRMSNGRANLHQGGIGAGVDLELGVTHHAVQRNHCVLRHPETGTALVGWEVPFWPQVIEMAKKVARAVGLGYIGVDVVVDAEQGPMLLEANARPGLAIQIANNAGLRPRVEAIDARLESAIEPQKIRRAA